MNRIFYIIIFITSFSLQGFSQKGGGGDRDNGGQVEALKIAYITKTLQLSTTEAQKFWPVYNKYKSEIRELRKEQERKNLPVLEVEEKMLAVRKKYNDEFSKAISAEKVNTFFRSEKEFANVVLKVLNEKRKGKGTH